MIALNFARNPFKRKRSSCTEMELSKPEEVPFCIKQKIIIFRKKKIADWQHSISSHANYFHESNLLGGPDPFPGYQFLSLYTQNKSVKLTDIAWSIPFC